MYGLIVTNGTNDTKVKFEEGMYKITYRKKTYSINPKKLIYVLSRFENLVSSKEDSIDRLLKKYDLYDEYFLEHVNNIQAEW